MNQDNIRKSVATRRSNERTKKTSITLADLAGGIAADATLAFGGSIFYTLIKSLGEHTFTYFKDRTEERFEDFYEALFYGEVTDEQRKAFLGKEIPRTTFDAVLGALVMDDESRKAPLYARFLRSIADKKLDRRWEHASLLALKRLSYDDLIVAKILYICTKHNVGLEDADRNYSPEQYPIEVMIYHSTNLQNVGLIFRGDKRRIVTYATQPRQITNVHTGEDSFLTEMFDAFVECIFMDDELLPFKMQVPGWKSKSMMLLWQQQSHDRFELLKACGNVLTSVGIDVGLNMNLAMVKQGARNLPFLASSNALLILYADCKDLDNIEYLKSRLARKNVFKAYFSESNSPQLDWLESIPALKTFFLRSESLTDIDLPAMKKYFSENLLTLK